MENYYLFDLRKVGSRIKNARKKCNLTQEQACKMANLTAQYWSLIENGHRASINAYLQIASVLEVTLNDLFYEESERAKTVEAYSFCELVAGRTDVEIQTIYDTLAWLEVLLEQLRKNKLIPWQPCNLNADHSEKQR